VLAEAGEYRSYDGVGTKTHARHKVDAAQSLVTLQLAGRRKDGIGDD
jgi:hypothetical protein